VAVVQVIGRIACTGLRDQVIAVSVVHLSATVGYLRHHLSVITVAVHHVVRGLAVFRLTGANAVGVVAVGRGQAWLLHFDELVAGIVVVAGDLTVFRLGQGVAVGVVAVAGAALLGEPVVIVVAVGRLHAVDDAVGAVAHLIELVLGVVVAVDRVGDGFRGQAVQLVIGVRGGAAVVALHYLHAPPRVAQGIGVVRHNLVRRIRGGQPGQPVQGVVVVQGDVATGVADTRAVAHRIVGVEGLALAVRHYFQPVQGVEAVAGGGGAATRGDAQLGPVASSIIAVGQHRVVGLDLFHQAVLGIVAVPRGAKIDLSPFFALKISLSPLTILFWVSHFLICSKHQDHYPFL